eukprot:829599-Pelagomonas_calceolata.AAC.2
MRKAGKGRRGDDVMVYKAGLSHGATNEFQADWHESFELSPAEYWLKYGGLMPQQLCGIVHLLQEQLPL